MLRTKFLTVAALSLVGLASAAVITSFVPSFQEMEKPTKEHEMLLKGVGHWTGTLTVHNPEGEPMVMPCTETVTALGKLWTQSQFSCSMGPVTYKGSGTFGYDAKSKEMIGTWVQNTDSHMAIMRGSIDPKTGELTMKWQAPVKEQGGKMVDHHSVATHTENSTEMKFFMDFDGTDVNFMTIAMERDKSHDHDHGDGVEDHDEDGGEHKGGEHKGGR